MFDKDLVPDFLKVPLAFTAMNIPNQILQNEREKRQQEIDIKIMEENIRLNNQMMESLYSW